MSIMPALPLSKLPSASEHQRQVAAARKTKSLPVLRSPPRRSPQKAAAPRQRPPAQLLPRADRAAPNRSEYTSPDRLQVLLREDALAVGSRTRVVFKPADPAQQRFVTAQHSQLNLFMGHHDHRAVVSDDDAVAQQCREAFQRRRRLAKSASDPPRKPPKHLPVLQETPHRQRVATILPMPFGPPVVTQRQPFSVLHLDLSTASPPIPPPLPAFPPLSGRSVTHVPLPGPLIERLRIAPKGPVAAQMVPTGPAVEATAGSGGPHKSRTGSKGSFAAAASVEEDIQLLSATGDVTSLVKLIVDTEIDSAVRKLFLWRGSASPLRTERACATEAPQRLPSLPVLPPTTRKPPAPPPASLAPPVSVRLPLAQRASVDGPVHWQGQAVVEWGLPHADAGQPMRGLRRSADATKSHGEAKGEGRNADALIDNLGTMEYLPPRKAQAYNGEAQEFGGWEPGP